jgi:replicative DNA helicase
MKEISPEILLNKDIANSNDLTSQPHNIDAEQIVLGNLLTNNETYNKLGEFLRAEHFFEPIHQKIYQTICDFFEQGLIATPITLKNFFDKEEALKNLGGSQYLTDLAIQASSSINIKQYGQVVFDLYLKRKLQTLGSEIIEETDQTAQSAEIIEGAEQKLFNLASEGNFGGDFQKLNISLNTALQTVQNSMNNEGFSGIPTNLVDLDKLLGGIQNSDLIILAGRPSMGKTALAINFAVNVCEYFAKTKSDKEPEKSVGFFSLEMSSEQLASRMISMKSGINAQKFRSGNFSQEDFAAIVKANNKLHQFNFFIDDTPALTISAIRTRARRLKRQKNLGILMVDYLQLLRGTGNNDNRVQEISQITQGLKAIAKELNIPVIALSQLSRAVEQRDDKRPQLSDLRESGSIEQDADIVMFIYREQYYIERKRPQEGTEEHSKWQQEMSQVLNKTEVIIAKQRHGAIGTANIRFEPSTTSFTNLAEQGTQSHA